VERISGTAHVEMTFGLNSWNTVGRWYFVKMPAFSCKDWKTQVLIAGKKGVDSETMTVKN
jgi:hypothetical protein